jgi:hypothetical protein
MDLVYLAPRGPKELSPKMWFDAAVQANKYT